MSDLIKKYLVSISGLLAVAFGNLISFIFKHYISDGLSDWITFSYGKVYSSGALFSLVFILIFSLTIKKVNFYGILLFSVINGLIYFGNIYAIAERIEGLDDYMIFRDIRLLFFPTVGAILLLVLLGKVSKISFTKIDYLIISLAGALPSLYEVVFQHSVNNTDRGHDIIIPWQIILPIGINLLILLPNKKAFHKQTT